MKKTVALFVIFAISLFGGSAAHAADPDCTGPDSPNTCEPDESAVVDAIPLEPSKPSTPDPEGPTVKPKVQTNDSLPVTGGDAVTLAVVGGGLVAGGVILLRSRRLATVEND